LFVYFGVPEVTATAFFQVRVLSTPKADMPIGFPGGASVAVAIVVFIPLFFSLIKVIAVGTGPNVFAHCLLLSH
jgi:hypothetical protein